MLVFTKGAPDVLLASCSREPVGEQPRPLSDTRRAEILKTNEALAANGHVRVEAPCGDMGFYVISDGSEYSYRVRIRTGSYTAMSIIDKLSKGIMALRTLGVGEVMTMFFGVLLMDIVGRPGKLAAVWCYRSWRRKFSGSIWLPMARPRWRWASIRRMPA